MSVVLREFRGLNNQRAPFDVPAGELSECVNFDVDDAGRLIARLSLTPVWTGAGAHSLYGAEGALYFRQADRLMRLAHGQAEPVDSGLHGPTCYSHAPGRLLYSDSQRCRMLQGGEPMDWGLPAPQAQASDHTGGDCQMTAVYLQGAIEHGAATPVMVGEDVTVHVPPHPGATHKAIYLSRPGGQVLHRAAVLPIDAGPTRVSAAAAHGAPLQTLHKTPPPPHTLSATSAGRALVAVDNFVLYSDPFALHLFDPLRQSIAFEHTVTLLAPLSAQVLIVGTTHAMYRLTGQDVAAAAIERIADCGAIAGASTTVNAASVQDGAGQGLAVLFATPEGFCLASAEGAVSRLTGGRFHPGRALSGSACVLRRAGAQAAVFTLHQ